MPKLMHEYLAAEGYDYPYNAAYNIHQKAPYLLELEDKAPLC